MRNVAGRTIALSGPRRLICDLLHFAHQVPTVPVQRRMDLAAVVAARAASRTRVSWCSIFTQAYARVAARMPELRRAYLTFPRPHLYEHPFSVASVAVERQHQGENAVLFGRLTCPEKETLQALDADLHRYKTESIDRIHVFRRALILSSLPGVLRRFLWWYALNVSGAGRAWRIGTFGVSVYSGLGAESLHPLSPLTTTLNYGVIDRGQVAVRLVYDHRVLDGATVARALGRLEEVLNGEMVAELRGGTGAAA
jgi:hypothetical protein